VLGSLPLGSRMTLRAGGGLYQQFPDLSQAFGSFAGSQVRHERARDLDAGLEYRSSPAVRWQVTLYDREERVGLRLEGDETRLVDGRLVLAVPDPVWHNALAGSSRGVEVEVQRRASTGLAGWIGYAYGRTRYHDALTAEAYWGDADQRHTLNAYGQYRLSTRTSLSAKLRMGSSFPIPGYLQAQGTNPDVMFAAETRNNVRVPVYSRLDLRANHTYNFTTRRLTLFVELLNVLARTNYAPSDGTITRTGQAYGFRDTLFPFLPSVGLMIDF
jgi:outer membrane cobalamin receptor